MAAHATSGMTVVIRSNGKARICYNLKTIPEPDQRLNVIGSKQHLPFRRLLPDPLPVERPRYWLARAP